MVTEHAVVPILIFFIIFYLSMDLVPGMIRSSISGAVLFTIAKTD